MMNERLMDKKWYPFLAVALSRKLTLSLHSNDINTEFVHSIRLIFFFILNCCRQREKVEIGEQLSKCEYVCEQENGQKRWNTRFQWIIQSIPCPFSKHFACNTETLAFYSHNNFVFVHFHFVYFPFFLFYSWVLYSRVYIYEWHAGTSNPNTLAAWTEGHYVNYTKARRYEAKRKHRKEKPELKENGMLAFYVMIFICFVLATWVQKKK